jgi:hypothetical protein
MAAAFYRNSSALSPHRQARTDLTATKMPTREFVQDAQDVVEEDFTLHYRVTDTDGFLDRLFPVKQKIIDTILQRMKDEGFYDTETQRWAGFPDPTRQGRGSKKSKENSMYGPFCAIAEAIREVAENLREEINPPDQRMGAMKWVDYHSKSPLTENTQAAQLRPDCLSALQVIASHVRASLLID